MPRRSHSTTTTVPAITAGETAVVDTAGVEAKAEVEVGAGAEARAKARTEQQHPQHQEQKQHTHAPTIHNTTTIAANPAKITTSLSTSIRPKPNHNLTINLDQTQTQPHSLLHYGTFLSSPTPSSPTSHLYYKGFAPRSPILHDSRNSRCARDRKRGCTYATTVVIVLWLLTAVAVAVYLFLYQRSALKELRERRHMAIRLHIPLPPPRELTALP